MWINNIRKEGRKWLQIIQLKERFVLPVLSVLFALQMVLFQILKVLEFWVCLGFGHSILRVRKVIEERLIEIERCKWVNKIKPEFFRFFLKNTRGDLNA